jgi:uncharacterized membrane protein
VVVAWVAEAARPADGETNMLNMTRLFRHLFFSPWLARLRFPGSSLNAIERAVHESESLHAGEIRFAVEASLTLPALLQGLGARERAAEVFSLLRVWDTEQNSGVLIYLLLAERDVEIVADRGLAAKVQPEEWRRICEVMEDSFRKGMFEAGAIEGVRAVGELLARHFPSGREQINELPNRPTVL